MLNKNKELEEKNKKLNQLKEKHNVRINDLCALVDNFVYNSIPVSLIKEKILEPMKEEHDKAIKGFIKRDIPQCIKDGGIAQELGYFI